MKKILLIGFIIILSVGLIGCTSATDEEYFEFDSGTGTIIGYDSAGGPDVVIPDEISGFEVKRIGKSSFYNIGLKSVELPYNIIKIKDNAFKENNLDSIEIPDSVDKISYNAFDENVEVIGKKYKVKFKAGGEVLETQKVNHGGSVSAPAEPSKENKPFLGWDSDFENVTSDLIVEANFATNTTYFEFDSDTGTITDYNEEGGSDVIIPSEIDGVDVEKIQGGFSEDESAFSYKELTSVEIPDSVTEIDSWAFADNELTSVEIPDSVTKIGDRAFWYNKLESVEIPDSVTEIGDMAFSDNDLTEIKIPDSVTEIGDFAFSDNRLTSVKIPDSITKIISGAFKNNNLKSIKLPDSVEEIGSNVFRDNELTEVEIPDSVEEIDIFAFSNNELTEVVLPSNIKEISTTAFDYPDDLGVGVFDGFLGSVYKNNNKASGTYVREDLDSDWELQE